MADLSRDEQDLARFGYKQELKRSLGVFSSFAVAFAYISPSTGIFALFFLGLTTVGGVFIWSWPIVAIGQLLVALGFAELSSHYPGAGSVFQWTKYLAGKSYSWFTGWIYLFAGILTVASVCATLPYALIPAFNNMGWNLTTSTNNLRWIAIVTLVLITVMNIFGVRLVAIVNNTGVVFEIRDGRRRAGGPGADVKPVVGGGRYDGLIQTLGASHPIPAVGCSIWLDRLAGATS